MNNKLTDESINLSIEVLELFSLGLKPSHKDLMVGLDSAIAGLRELQIARQRIAELQSVNDELKKFPDQIVNYVARLGTSEIGGHTKNVIYRAAQKVKDSAAGIGKGE